MNRVTKLARNCTGISVTKNIHNFRQYFYLKTKLMGNTGVHFNVIDQLLIRYSAFVRYQKRNANVMG
jgi:hypothetical protein